MWGGGLGNPPDSARAIHCSGGDFSITELLGNGVSRYAPQLLDDQAVTDFHAPDGVSQSFGVPTGGWHRHVLLNFVHGFLWWWLNQNPARESLVSPLLPRACRIAWRLACLQATAYRLASMRLGSFMRPHPSHSSSLGRWSPSGHRGLLRWVKYRATVIQCQRQTVMRAMIFCNSGRRALRPALAR